MEQIVNEPRNAQNSEHTRPTTCPKCGRQVESMPGVPANFCTWCGTPTTSDAIRERIVHLMALGLQDDIRKAVARLEQTEPEHYGRLAAIVTGRIG